MRVILLFISVALSATWAQFLTPAMFPPQLKAYLVLTDDQVIKIQNLNQQLASYQVSKMQRQSQVQMELAEETAKEHPDPLAIGQRYVELESIRRELEAQQKTTASQAQAILTAEQKAKIAVLQQALSLQNTACSAISQNLLTPVPGVTGGITPFPSNIIPISRVGISYSSFLLGGLATGPCAGTTSTWIETGAFSPVPLPAP